MTQQGPLDPAQLAIIDAVASRVEAGFDKRFTAFERAFEARLKFVEGQVFPSSKPNPPPDGDAGAAVVATIPPIVLPNGVALNGTTPPPGASLAHRTDSLERKVNRLLKAHGVSPEEVGAAQRVFRWVISPEGRKQLAAFVAAVAATYGAYQAAARPPLASPPLPAVVAPR